MSVTISTTPPISSPTPRPPDATDPKREAAMMIATNAIASLDRNRDGALGRDEYVGAQFGRLDTDGDGFVKQDEAIAALSALELPVLQAMARNAGEARWAIDGAQPIYSQRGRNAALVGGLGAGLAAALIKLRPVLRGSLIGLGVLVAAGGAYMWASQPGNTARARQQLSSSLDQALQGQMVNQGPYQVSSPLGLALERTVDNFVYAVKWPFMAMRDLLMSIVIFLHDRIRS